LAEQGVSEDELPEEPPAGPRGERLHPREPRGRSGRPGQVPADVISGAVRVLMDPGPRVTLMSLTSTSEAPFVEAAAPFLLGSLG
jgi:hypothetical protein